MQKLRLYNNMCNNNIDDDGIVECQLYAGCYARPFTHIINIIRI